MRTVEYGKENKDVVILLHGGGLSWWNYRQVAALLAEDYHVILPILDGHAGSDAGFTSIEDNAVRIIGEIDARFGGHITALGGLSLGGQIVLEILTRRPDICRFALIESALVMPMKLTGVLMGPSIAMSYGLIKQRWFSKLQASYLGIPMELFEDYYRDTCAISQEDMVAFLKANCTYSARPAMAAISARVKIVAGMREQKKILDSAKLLCNTIPDSDLELLPGLRHGDLSINHPERYIQMLKVWES